MREINKGLMGIVLLLTVALGVTYYVKINPATDIQSPSQVVEPPAAPVQPVSPPITPETGFDDALRSIKTEDLKTMLGDLADYKKYKGRVTGTPENVEAAKWIKQRLESYGLQTMYDEFNTGRGSTKNVYAWIDGGEQPNEVIVVGAHFDHVGNSPGADDNASGTVLVLELAQAFSMLPKKEIKRTLVFQLYSGEEMGLLGSKAYCANPKFPKEAPGMGKHVFMLNADMVGRLNGHQYTMLYEEMVDDIGQIVQDLSSRYRFALSITKRGAGGSDQTPFLNKGVPVAWLFTGSHRDYHRSTDTADKIDYDGLEKISRYAFELVYRVDHNKRYMQLNYDDYDKGTSEFNESLYDHDQPSTPFPYPLRKDSGF